MTRLVLVTALLLAALPGRASADDLAALVSQADMAYRGKTSAAVLSMQIKTAAYERSYELVLWSDSRGEEKTLVKILGPALWRGFGTLKVGGSLKLYDPKADHVTVVSHSMLGDSWMGSHFSNDDLVKETRLAEDFDARLVSSSQAGGATRRVVELTPRPTAPVAWGKILFTVDQDADGVRPVRSDYFRKTADARPERSIEFGDVRELAGRKLQATVTVTVAAKPGEHTRIEYKTLKLGIDVDAGKFTEQALRK